MEDFLKSPTPAVEGTMGTCAYSPEWEHTQSQHLELCLPGNWKPLAPSDSQGTKEYQQCAGKQTRFCRFPAGHSGDCSWEIPMKKAAPSLNSVDTPTNLSAEPSYPNHETVLLSMRDPDWCCHEKSAKCSIEAPHEIKNCGEFSVDTPAPVPERTNKRINGWDERDYRFWSEVRQLPNFGLIAPGDKMISLDDVLLLLEKQAETRFAERMQDAPK